MQKQREIMSFEDEQFTMRGVIENEEAIRKDVYDNKNPLPDSWIARSEKQALQGLAHDIAKKRLGLFKYKLFTGKLGIDTFFLVFAAFGMFVIPAYFYVRDYSRKQAFIEIRKERGLDNLDEADVDERSFDYTIMPLDEIRKERLKKAHIYAEVERLEKELYYSRELDQ